MTSWDAEIPHGRNSGSSSPADQRPWNTTGASPASGNRQSRSWNRPPKGAAEAWSSRLPVTDKTAGSIPVSTAISRRDHDTIHPRKTNLAGARPRLEREWVALPRVLRFECAVFLQSGSSIPPTVTLAERLRHWIVAPGRRVRPPCVAPTRTSVSATGFVLPSAAATPRGSSLATGRVRQAHR